MSVVRIGSIRWFIGTWVKDWGERAGCRPLVSLGKKIRWGR